MKRFLSVSLATLALASAASARAHFIWATVVPGEQPGEQKVRLEVAESPGESVVPMLGRMLSAIQKTKIGDLTDEADHRHLLGPLAPKSSAGSVRLTYGVHGTDLVTWSAKAAANLEAASRSLGTPFEIVLGRTKAGLKAYVKKDGKPVAGAPIKVYLPGKKEPLTKKSAADGSVELPAMSKGLLALGAVVPTAGSGEYKGKHYQEIKEMVSLTVPVDK